MDTLNINVVEVLAVWMGGVVALVAAGGLAARFAVKPVLDSVARMRAAGRGAEAESRVEEQLGALAGAMERLAEALERREQAQR
jgi:hypothetical protein